MPNLTILICTHNRALLLSRVIESINAAVRPADATIKLLVIANACSDDTVVFLKNYGSMQHGENWIPLTWQEEPTPGKSHALNRAIPLINSDLVAFVDDDQRIQQNFLVSVINATTSHLEFSMFCGRLLPDWDGSEPNWVHDKGRYKIRPLPVPCSDNGPVEKELTIEDPTPPGGDIIVRTTIFDRIGNFNTEFGPHGHDLGGSEDTIFIQKALNSGERLIYCPNVIQYHFVDTERLKFSYIVRKAFHRNRSTILAKQNICESGVPLYLWRKLLTYILFAILSFRMTRLRYFILRVASTLGEISALRKSNTTSQSVDKEKI